MIRCVSRALAARTLVTAMIASWASIGCGGSTNGAPNSDASSETADAASGDAASNVDVASGGDTASGGDSTPAVDATSEGGVASTADASAPLDAKAPSDGSRPGDATSDAVGQGDADAGGPRDSGADDDAAASIDARLPSDAAGADVACLSLATPRTLGGTARSSGFSGTALAYDSISGAACATGGDCVPTCVAAGGTTASCAAGSACVLGEARDGGVGCFPPSYWMSPNLAFSELDMTGSAAALTMVATSYFDSLMVTNFAFSVPDGAIIRGIQFDVRRATMFGAGEDMSIQVLQNGVSVGTNHRVIGTPWPTTLTYVTYGGPSDTWGVSWTAADIRASGFGIAITPQYTQMAGNEPAYVDSVRAIVYYSQCN